MLLARRLPRYRRRLRGLWPLPAFALLQLLATPAAGWIAANLPGAACNAVASAAIIATMPLPLNPYVAGNPVGDSSAFVGRTDVLREVLRVLRRQPKES